ncbi:hypothetical protein QBC34DRAFT_384056 [Podospora aff. communis PSN243]|uniref:Uncharacterized protein n=1 Tax=Podospora aff. communis PSN243 TaxID=3040156 RepID=A0AAV9GEC0_9PEZI|nr:hypothetical protein QBC34DRAFT_384056 [Podospora aff. communis PSN243]
MEKAGFVRIEVLESTMPVRPWGEDERRKELGEFIRLGWLRDPEVHLLFLANVL